MGQDEELLKSLFGEYEAECRQRLQRVSTILEQLQLSGVDLDSALIQDARREMHTLKGNSGIMGFQELQALAYEAELQLNRGTTSGIAEKLKTFEEKLNLIGLRMKR
jgi:HPt (histidine-containing phosphotransfer) domain-containing protein